MQAIGENYRDRWVDVLDILNPPVDLENEVLILPLSPQVLLFLSLAFGIVINYTFDNFPVAVVTFGNFPAGEVVAIEKRYESCRSLLRTGKKANTQQEN